MTAPKNESPHELSRKVEFITIGSGLGLALLSLAGLALTGGNFRPVGFLSLATIGAIVAAVGLFELRKVNRTRSG
jgi:hypothetical protein